MTTERLPAVVEVDLTTSRRGRPSVLLEKIGAWTILEWTISGVLECARVASPVVLCRSGEAARVVAALGSLPVRVVVDDTPDIPTRARLRRGRLWGKAGCRGGIGDAYFVCEAGNPHTLLRLAQSEDWPALLIVPAEAAFIDPVLVDELAHHYLTERRGAPAYLSTAPPGFAADILHRSLLETLVERNTSLDGAYPFLLDRPELDPDLHRVFHHYPERIIGARARLTADTQAQLEMMRTLWLALGGRQSRPTVAEVLAGLEARPDLVAGCAPEEFIVETCADGLGARAPRRAFTTTAESELERTGVATDCLTPANWRRVLAGLERRDDALVVFGGGYADPLLDSALETRVAAARAAGAIGIAIESCGSLLTPARAESLLASRPDVVCVELGAVTSSDLAAMQPGRPPWELRRAGLEALLNARKTQRDAPFVLVAVRFSRRVASTLESFMDDWWGVVDRVIVRSHDDSRGALCADAAGNFAPPVRSACHRVVSQLRIEWDGRVPLCQRDPEHAFAVSRLDAQPVAELWQGARFALARAAHARRDFAELPHCGPCNGWYRFD
ncbi:MAG: SPASM domain-containing protein [Planctomycetota bacterium]